MKKVMFLMLGMMPCRAVVVWRDLKYSTSVWRGGGNNTYDQSQEAEVRSDQPSSWICKVKDIVDVRIC